MKLETNLTMSEQVKLLAIVRSNEELNKKWKERVRLLYGMKREGLLDAQQYHYQYCRSLKAYALNN